jgi:hypothetical protein
MLKRPGNKRKKDNGKKLRCKGGDVYFFIYIIPRKLASIFEERSRSNSVIRGVRACRHLPAANSYQSRLTGKNN